MGLGVYAGGAHRFAVIVGASGGYLVSLPITAMLVGYLAERRCCHGTRRAIGALRTHVENMLRNEIKRRAAAGDFDVTRISGTATA